MKRNSLLDENMSYVFSPDTSEERIHKDYDFEVITPMFGGGSKSWELDKLYPVREQAVKGQLRFWWRAMQSKEDSENLLYTENNLWGGKTIVSNGDEKRIVSQVTIRITQSVKGNNVISDKGQFQKIIPQYVLFPVTTGEENIGNPRICLIKTLKFTLHISYPNQNETEVINSLKLWTLFGGVGARTRRGTGSLYCEELLQEFEDISNIKRFLNDLVLEQENGDRKLAYPRIAGSKLFSRGVNDIKSDDAWRNLIQQYASYRQDRSGHNNWGRSHWPEPDAIRLLTDEKAANHDPKHPDNLWFPRAVFGLPIMTGFSTYGDPGKTDNEKKLNQNISLEPDIDSGDRFPSPVIFKIIKLPNGTIYQCVLALNQSFPERLTLKLKYSGKSHSIHGGMLPEIDVPTVGKTMRTSHPLNGQSILQDLAVHLRLGEII